MAPGIVKILDRYVRWSSVCDAPADLFESLEDACESLESESARTRLRETGTTYTDVNEDDLSDFGLFNRAGPNETCIGRETFITAMDGFQVRLYVNGEWGMWKVNLGYWTKQEST
jgi:hypothetical protein